MKGICEKAAEFLEEKAEKVLVVTIKGDEIISSEKKIYKYENKSERPGTRIFHPDGRIENLNVYQVVIEKRMYLYEEYLFLYQSGMFYLGLRCASHRPEEDCLPQEINWEI